MRESSEMYRSGSFLIGYLRDVRNLVLADIKDGMYPDQENVDQLVADYSKAEDAIYLLLGVKK